MRTLLLTLVLLPLGAAALLLLVFTAGMPFNEWMAWQLSRKLGTVAHPAGTAHVHSRRQVGLLTGNGNHCDYFAGELRTYSGSRAELLAFYSGKELQSPLGRHQAEVQVAFFEASTRNERLPHAHDEPTEWGLSPEAADRFYVVYLFDGGHDPGYDLRCH